MHVTARIVIVGFTVAFVAAGGRGVTATQDIPASPSIVGPWHLNPSLSVDGAAMRAALHGSPDSEEAGQGARAGRSGGRGGGMGGRAGGTGRGPGGTTPSTSDQGKARDLLQELTDAPERVAILIAAGRLKIADSSGAVCEFPIDGKPTPVALGSTTVEVTTSWEGAVLTQQLKAGPLALTRTLQTTPDGMRLLIALKMAAGRGAAAESAPPGPMTFVYDRE